MTSRQIPQTLAMRRRESGGRSWRLTACAGSACWMLAAVSACRNPSESAARRPPPARQGFIAVVGAGEPDELWPVLRASALRCGHEFGGTAVRTFTPNQVSQNRQIELIQSLRGEGLRALCVQMIDPAVAAPFLKDIRNSGVFVVTLMRSAPSPLRFHHCGPYEPDVGRAMARALAEALDNHGTVAVLRSSRPAEDQSERYRAFDAELGKHVGLRVLRDLRHDGDARRAETVLRDFCQRFPRLQGLTLLDDLFPTQTEDRTVPLAPPDCRVVGLDPYPSNWALLADGRCYALVGTQYERVAYKAVQWCLLAAEGIDIEVQTCDTGVQIVTAKNLAEWQEQWRRWVQAPTP